MRNIAIIGGTGIYNPATFQNFETIEVMTPYGLVTCLRGKLAGHNITFITRHGAGHKTAPHKVNYRANIWALKKLEVTEIFATTAVGSLNKTMPAGTFVVCNQIIDFTKSRINTFYDTPEKGVVHVDFSYPYCPVLRQRVIACLEKSTEQFATEGTYVCTEGPRFETAAEIKMYKMLGGDLVGMTNMPEALLAREAEICYVNVSIVTNMAAGISETLLSHNEVVEAMDKSIARMNNLIADFINYSEDEHSENTCSCPEALKEFGGFKL